MRRLLCALVAGAFAVEVNVPGLGSLKGQQGVPQGKDVAFFGGIPYAKPPIGALRWQPPVPHGPWKSPRNAGWTNLGHQCVQPGMGDEDCLYLNVHTLTAALEKNMSLPAMVWIHGGSYTTGSGNIYTPLANEMVDRLNPASVVVITINYRLNVFGFLASQEIKERSTDKSAGNFGIQDQRLAMQWVKDHISAFGGDGNAVTIFGESAGGNSVFNHLAQPASFTFYKNAIIESGAYNLGAMTLASAEEAYKDLLSGTSCKDLDCLLKLDARKLLEDSARLTQIQSWHTLKHSHGWGPVIDEVSLTAAPADLIQAGKYNKKAVVIIGSNRDEEASGWFVGGELAPNLTEAGFDAFYVAQKGKGDLEKVKALYDPSVYPYPKDLGKNSHWWWAGTRVATDQVPGLGPCGVRWLARKLAQGGSTVYAYLFARPCQSFGAGAIPGCQPGSVIAPHAGEIPYVFGDLMLTWPAEDRTLSRKVSAYWGHFATAGAFDSGDWPKFNTDSDVVKRFDVAAAGGIVTQEKLRKAACDFWEAKMPQPEITV